VTLCQLSHLWVGLQGASRRHLIYFVSTGSFPSSDGTGGVPVEGELVGEVCKSAPTWMCEYLRPFVKSLQCSTLRLPEVDDHVSRPFISLITLHQGHLKQ